MFEDNVSPPLAPPGWVNQGGTRLWRPWKLEHLQGERPQDHPLLIRRNDAKEALFEKGQVWMDKQNGVLVVIHHVMVRDGFSLTLLFYRHPEQMAWKMSEAEFRSRYTIWDDAKK